MKVHGANCHLCLRLNAEYDSEHGDGVDASGAIADRAYSDNVSTGEDSKKHALEVGCQQAYLLRFKKKNRSRWIYN